jgi:hypothetical protein
MNMRHQNEKLSAPVTRFLQPVPNAPFVHDHKLTPYNSHVPLSSSFAYRPHTSSTDDPGRFTNCRTFESIEKVNSNRTNIKYITHEQF